MQQELLAGTSKEGAVPRFWVQGPPFVQGPWWGMCWYLTPQPSEMSCFSATVFSNPSVSNGSVEKSLPANAGDTGSTPDPGRSHMLQSNRARGHSYQACALEPRSCNYWSPRTLEPMLCNRQAIEVRSPCTATTQKPNTATKTKHTQNYINTIAKKHHSKSSLLGDVGLLVAREHEPGPGKASVNVPCSASW